VKPRIAIGQLAQETNQFVPMRTTLDHFATRLLLRGAAVLTGFGAARVEVPGFIDTLRAAGAEIVPLLCAAADSGGPVTRAAFEALLGELLDRLHAAGPVDGVLLALHGAMVTEHLDDPEAEIIAQVRAALPAGTPIGVSLDLHGHITAAMLQPDVILVGYRAYPHIDMHETGVRTAELLLDRLRGRSVATALAKRAMVVSPVRARTVEPPLSDVVAMADAMLADRRLLHAALFPVQPWLDVPDLGFAVLTVAEDASAAQAAADALADAAFARRRDFEPNLVPLEAAIATGLRQPGMTLIGDAGDGPTGGAGADRAEVLLALLAAGADRAEGLTLITLCNPPAAAQAHASGAGATHSFTLGGHFTGGPRATVTARIERLHDGKFVSLDAGAKGFVVNHGPSAVLAVGSLRIALRTHPGWEWDTNLYRSLGLDPAAARMCFVKSSGHFRVAFEPLAARTIMADTPGPTCGNMHRVAWSRVTRPLFPMDAI
jgi:microcystin degradation protein MlrC